MLYDLVFEGGGAKGMAFLGAVQELEKRGYQYGRLMGTSAGSISATFLSAGFDSAEMEPILAEKEDNIPVFTRFMGVPTGFSTAEVQNGAMARFLKALDLPLVPDFIEGRVDNFILKKMSQDEPYVHIFSFIERGGWYSADYFVTWLRNKLNSGHSNGKPRQYGDMSLRQFHEATQRHLTLVAADTTNGRLLVLNHKTAPDCPLVWAVRMSMSVPLLWQEVVWQKEWGLYRKQDIAGNRVVDGGLLSNFPIELFISSQPYVTDLMGPKETNLVLGLLIDEKIPVPGTNDIKTAGTPAAQGVQISMLETVQRVQRLVDTMTQAHDKMVIDSFEHLVVRLPARGYGTTEFDMSDERRALLISAARTAVKTHIDASSTAAMSSTNDAEWDDGPTLVTDPKADQIAMRMLEQ